MALQILQRLSQIDGGGSFHVEIQTLARIAGALETDLRTAVELFRENFNLAFEFVERFLRVRTEQAALSETTASLAAKRRLPRSAGSLRASAVLQRERKTARSLSGEPSSRLFG